MDFFFKQERSLKWAINNNVSSFIKYKTQANKAITICNKHYLFLFKTKEID